MHHVTSQDDRAFLSAFETCEVSPADFDHAAHVRLAYIYLCEHSVDTAVARMKDALLAFLTHLGVGHAKYHETVTRAWIMAVSHFMNESAPCESAAEFMTLHPRLLDSKIMLKHYSADVLFSAEARQSFIQPNVRAIPQHPELDRTLQDTSQAVLPPDFDFIIGNWNVSHRRLNARLQGCKDWTEFRGTSSTRKILGGFGNVEDNVLHFPEGDVRAAAIRSYDSRTRSWAIWWLDDRAPHSLDPPVVGGFSGTVGTFLANDVLDGRPIQVRFIWRTNPGSNPAWEQAFSADAGATWETNWTMEFQRSGADGRRP